MMWKPSVNAIWPRAAPRFDASVNTVNEGRGASGLRPPPRLGSRHLGSQRARSPPWAAVRNYGRASEEHHPMWMESAFDAVVMTQRGSAARAKDGGGGNRTRVRGRPVQNVYKLRLPLSFARRPVGSRPTAGLAILWCRTSGDWLSLGAEPVF